MKPPDWFPDWRGQRCVIIASGPSAATAEVEMAQGKARVVAINNSWQLAPWADALYGCDFHWWHAHKGVPEFSGLKISQVAGWGTDRQVAYPDIKFINCDMAYDRKTDLVGRPGLTGWGGNSGFQALSMAIQFDANPILLVGFDMRTDLGIHWHAGHPKGLNNPDQHLAEKWRKAIDNAAPTLREIGVIVVNCSEVSALKAYPKMTLAEALVL